MPDQQHLLPDGDRKKTIQELEGEDWGEGDFFPSYLVKTCHALRRKPLCDFTVEDLRIMIGQNIGLPYLMPLAIKQLQRDPLASGDFYEGDLLISVLRAEASFWQEHPDLHAAVQHIVATMPSFPENTFSGIIKDFEKALARFNAVTFQ